MCAELGHLVYQSVGLHLALLVSGSITASCVKISTPLHPIPASHQDCLDFKALTLRKTPEEQDAALPTGTQG
ncbi:hypothetical protein PR003_g23111, partial [Phytophthora rubi]